MKTPRKRTMLAIGTAAAAIVTVGVASTMQASAATGDTSGPYTISIGLDESDTASSAAAADCNARAMALLNADVETLDYNGDGRLTVVYTCIQP